MMPTELPVLEHPPVLLREFTGADAGLRVGPQHRDMYLYSLLPGDLDDAPGPA